MLVSVPVNSEKHISASVHVSALWILTFSGNTENRMTQTFYPPWGTLPKEAKVSVAL